MRAPGSSTGAITAREPILIPKRLRMEWTDALALDAELSHVAFRVACVIGSHFNRYSGSTFVKQETIARIMNVSERAVWAAVRDLEARGVMLVKRREFGTHLRTKKDGSVVTVREAGGRGVANVYLPAFEGSHLTKSHSGQKLAARCEQWWRESSQKLSRKAAARCDPTLTPSKYPSSAPTGVEATESKVVASWEAVKARLTAELGVGVVASWFDKLTVEGIEGGIVTLIAPTRFHKNWTQTHYNDRLLNGWQAVNADVRSIQLTVKAAASGHYG